MDLPLVTDESFTERDGVNKVAVVVNGARCIWRETPLRDVGIDGQIEHVNTQRQATGRIVLVQVKSGPSYFERASEIDVPFYPSGRHLAYWGHAPLPVVLVLHNPDSGETIWSDARRAIQSGRGSPIRVPRQNVFDRDGVLDALAWDGAPLPEEPQEPRVLLRAMIEARHEEASFPLSYFDLFVNGLTDIGYSLFFDMGIPTEVARSKLVLADAAFGIGIGGPEYAFLDDYVAFVVANDLARFDFDWYRQCLEERGMVATMLGALTPRGRALVQYIAGLDRNRDGDRGPWDQVVVERFIGMNWDREPPTVRTAWIEGFKEWLATTEVL